MIDLKIFAKTIEDTALNQIELLCNQPAFENSKIRIMPDVHAGAGCVIGFTADMGDKVVPNLVGVDIGCGMFVCFLGRLNTVDFDKLDKVIRTYVPSGMNVHDSRIVKFPELQELKCYRDLKDTKRIERSIGTLGGGNHFIEINKNESGYYYLVIHTGSRNLGKQVCDYYQNLAYDLMQGKDELFKAQKDLIKKYKNEGRKNEIQSALKKLRSEFVIAGTDIPKDLAYLTGEYRESYLHDMQICQVYADVNRTTIADVIIENMGWEISGCFHTVHNYIDFCSNIIRKGAVRALNGERLIIPMNMRDGSLICLGKGNSDWNCSAPHGAGRVMSRSKAFENLSIDVFKDEMKNVYSTSVCNETLDESPMAYKPMDEIIECIKDTVDIVDVIKPVYNFKASE